MARLRLVGRPGRRFGHKGLRFASASALSSASTDEGRGGGPKGQLVVNVHRGLRDFVSIAGGEDSDDEEDFHGFTEDEIQLVVKKTSDLLALVKSSEDVTVSSVEEISGRLRQRVLKTTNKPFLKLVKSRYNRHSMLTSTPLTAAVKRQYTKKPVASLMPETLSKPMKGSIKVRLLGKGFLAKKLEKRPTESKDKSIVREEKKQQKPTPVSPAQKEKPSKRLAPTKIARLKTVAKSVKEALSKRKRKRSIHRGKVARGGGTGIKYRLADGRKREKLKSEDFESSPGKRRSGESSSLPTLKTRKGFPPGLKRGAKVLNRRHRKFGRRGAKFDDGEDEKSSEPFCLPSESGHSHRKIRANKRFLDGADTSIEPVVKKPRLKDRKSENVEKDIIGDHISSGAEPHNLAPVSENKDTLPNVSKKIPMFDAPLICDSKRHRRPAQKLIMKLSEDFDLNLKRSRKSVDGLTAGFEISSGDEAFDASPKLTRNPRPGRFGSGGNKSLEGLSSVSKSDLSVDETSFAYGRNSTLPSLPNTSTVLAQKNKDLGAGGDQSERENSEIARKRRKGCCVCSGNYKMSRYIGCRHMVCRHCFRFYSSKAKLVMKGSLNLLCISGGCCAINWKTVSSCDACRYRKCLEYFPPPEDVINLKSGHKSVTNKREKHSSSQFPLPPIAKDDSPWNAELLKFLKASESKEGSAGTEDNLNAPGLSAASAPSSLDPDLGTGPSRRLCKFGKSRTTAPRAFDISHETIKNLESSIRCSPGFFDETLTAISNFASNIKPELSSLFDGRKSDELMKLNSLEVKDSAVDSLVRCETRRSSLKALIDDQQIGNLPLFAPPKVLTDGLDATLQVPEKFGAKGADSEAPDGADSEASDRKGDSRGPRIKHVCRKAAVVLGKPLATFPRSELCLSALPSLEKERILQHEDDSQDSSDVAEVNGVAKEQVKDPADSESLGRRSLSKKTKSTKRAGGPKKTLRCKNCVGCLTPECGKCAACKDMPKNGGRGTLKHACIHRVCRNPILPWHKLTPEKLAKAKLEKEVRQSQPREVGPPSAFNRSRGRPRVPLLGGKKFQSKLNSVPGVGHAVPKVRPLRLPKISTGVDDKVEKSQMTNKTKNSEVPLPQTVKVDFNESTDIEVAWKRGMALYSLSSCNLRAACRLCGSAGQQEMFYCSVCCEPFHSFCLEEKDRPKDGCDTWCCLQCQFCHVCYGQSNLLQCDKCQESYHPECLGPNYPTKPSRRKRIWVCSKCVRCRSCGATTPGNDKDATWMCDFSLCYGCGLLMEKGNFCPVCRKCYTDDDWESQMIQCYACHSWVHSKCEELTDEMYQVVTYMPEDVPFNCRVCCPTRPSVWEVLIRQEMQGGMKSVLDALVQSKSLPMLESIKDTNTEVDATLLASEDYGGTATKQVSKGQKLLREGFDGPRQTKCPVNDSERGNSDAFLEPFLDDPGFSSDPSHLIAIPDLDGVAKVPAQPDLVKIDGCLKDILLSDTKVIESNQTLLEGLCLPKNEKLDVEAVPAQTTDDRRVCYLESTIVNFNEAVLTASALDNVCSRASSGYSSDGKLNLLLPCGLEIKDFDDLRKDTPRDFTEISAKLGKDSGYSTIEEFAADVTRIIRYNLELKEEEEDEEATSLRASACATVRSIFVKQMEKCFPWFQVKSSRCWSATNQSPKNGVMDQAVLPPSNDHTYAHWLEKEAVPAPSQPSLFRNTKRDCTSRFGNILTEGDRKEAFNDDEPKDARCCAFCWTYGDADEEEAGRLISAGQDDWVHINCALWSAEVYEEVDGTLKMVHAALARSRKLRCDMCGRPGATVGCCQQGCNSNFHFTCARRKNCAFLETKKMFCELHWMAVDADLIADGNFSVCRRICVNPTSNRGTKRQWVMGVDPSNVNIFIGSLVVESLGRLSPLSDSKSALLPVDFCISRMFWSTEDPRQRSIYVCRVVEVIPKAKAPEVINDITIIHDADDPRYDMALAMSFTFTAQDESDESTLSAFEGDPGLSDSEIEPCGRELRGTRVERGLGSKPPVSLKDKSALWKNEEVVKPLKESRLSKSCSDPMNSDAQNDESSRRMSLSFAGVFEDNRSQSRSAYSRLSASTLKMLGLRNSASTAGGVSSGAAEDSDDELMLVKIASRLNEAAAKNKMQEHHRRIREGNGSDATEASAASVNGTEDGTKGGIGETDHLGNRDRSAENVTIKNLVQMDGPAAESDSEDCCSEDLNLVADVTSEDESNSQHPSGREPLRTSPEKCSSSSGKTDAEGIVGQDKNCMVSVVSGSETSTGCGDNSTKISDEIFSSNCHLMNSIKGVETKDASTSQQPLFQPTSILTPPMALAGTLSAAELLKNVVARHVDSTIRPPGLNPALCTMPRFTLPTGSEGTGVVPPQVRFALSQLLNPSSVSYLGSVAVNTTSASHLQQVIGNFQFPVRPSNASPMGLGQLATGLPPVRPVSFGFSAPPQIQVTAPGSVITPDILKSLQQVLGESRASQPLFFKLANSNPPSERPSAPAVGPPFASSSSSSSSLNLLSLNRPTQGPLTWLPSSSSSSLGVLSSQTANEFNHGVVNAIPLYAGSQAVPPVQPVIPGVKRPLPDGSDNMLSKRMKSGDTRATAASHATETVAFSGPRPSPAECSGPSGMTSDSSAVRNTKHEDRSEIHLGQNHGSCRTANYSQKKSLAKPSGDRNSSNGLLSNILNDRNRRDGQSMRLGSAKKSHQKSTSGNNRKSKPAPMFEPHPMFRPHLPEAEIEEEIENSPLLAMLETEELRIKEEAQQKKNAPHLVFEITGSDGFHVQADSLNKAWKAVTDRVQDARLSAGMKPVSFIGMNGLYMTGLNHPAVVYLVEQLPGFKRFHNYEFKYHPPSLEEEDDEIIENPHGCARAESLSSRNKYETFSFLLSRYRNRPEYDPSAAHEENIMANKSQRRSTSLDLPMAMRFRHLRTFAKEAVGVYRSNIHGRGLFCKRDIDAGEMIIEYSGEVIRAILTDKREKHYESKAIGCYMFRKDRDHVIDSTMMGNAARFINHSCDPNCYSKVILVDNRKHIVIFAQRAIKRGEELTYDYKFPIEDVKIPCTCGSRRCRKYLN